MVSERLDIDFINPVRQRAVRKHQTSSLLHARECNVVVGMTFNLEGAFSRFAPDWIDRRDIGADHDIRIACEAGVVYSCAALRQPDLARTDVSEYLQVPTAEGITPVDARTIG